MWSRFINIMQHVWKNPVVQFSCITLLEWFMFLFHKNTKNKYKHNKKKRKYSDACAQDYSVGTSEDTPEQIPAEKIRKKRQKVVIEKTSVRNHVPEKKRNKLEETPSKPNKISRKRSSSVKETKTTKKRKTPDKV